MLRKCFFYLTSSRGGGGGRVGVYGVESYDVNDLGEVDGLKLGIALGE